MRTTSLIPIFLVAITPPLQAQTANEDDLETITVTAERLEVPLSDVGSSIEVISAQDLIDGQFIFILDALDNLPGVTVSQNGSLGGLAAIRIRGASSEQTLVLVDGVILNDPSAPGAGFNFATLSPHDIERIEVLKGPQSTLYGSDAIGGVINIITKSGGDGPTLSAFFEGGSFETLSTGGTLSVGDKARGLRLSVSNISSDGISKAEKRDGNTEKDGYDGLTLSGKGNFKLAEALSAWASVRYVDSESEFDSFGFVTGVTDGDELTESEEINLITGLNLSLFEGRFTSEFSFLFSRIERENFTAGVSSFAAEGERSGFAYRGTLDGGKLGRLAFGAKSEEVRFETTFDAPAEFTIKSLYANWLISPVEALSLSAGIRFDDHETFGSATTVRVTGSYLIAATGTRLRANYGEGFKAPTPFQLTFSCCGGPGPNPNLEPENSSAWEIGLEQSLAGDRVQFSATFFRRTTSNLIDFSFVNGNFDNVARTRAKGIELGLQAKLSDDISFSGSYTYVSAVDRATGLQRARVPKSSAHSELTWQASSKIRSSLSFTYNGAESDSFGNNKSWVRLDLKASYAVSDMIEVYGRIENLLDENYQDVFGFGTPGLAAYGGLRVRF